MCWPLHCLCRPFCNFERCLDSKPESCRSKHGCATNLATHLPDLATHLPELATHLPNVATHLPNLNTHLSNLATHLPYLVTHLPNLVTHLQWEHSKFMRLKLNILQWERTLKLSSLSNERRDNSWGMRWYPMRVEKIRNESIYVGRVEIKRMSPASNESWENPQWTERI